MQQARKLLPVAFAVSAALMTGCAGKRDAADTQLTGTPFEVTEYAPDLREHHTSWGHAGRGGAALRKPTYQPVLGSPEVLETRAGKLYPELQPQAHQSGVSIAVPPSILAGTCAQAEAEGAGAGAAVTVMTPTSSDPERIYTLANSRGTVNDYIQVRNKLCKGAERLTYEEWEILVMGTPKDVPLTLQPFQKKMAK